MTATITIDSTYDVSGLPVWVYASHPDLVIFEDTSEWQIDLKANQPTLLMTTFHFANTGWFDIFAATRPTDFVPSIDGVTVEVPAKK